MDMSKESAAWLERQYIEWQRGRGKRGTITEFAEWLGVSRGTYNNWIIKKQTPGGDSLVLLGEKLGWEIYDIVGEPRPHPVQQLTVKMWGKLTDDEIRAIERIVKRAEKRSSEAPTNGAAEPERAG